MHSLVTMVIVDTKLYLCHTVNNTWLFTLALVYLSKLHVVYYRAIIFVFCLYNNNNNNLMSPIGKKKDTSLPDGGSYHSL